jgi:predicted ArsR family transcriptional regulator
LLRLLREEARTVDDLAAALDLTDNAVRFHLTALEEEGTVERLGSRRHPGVGQPAILYGLTPDAEIAQSRAYAPVLAACISELSNAMPKEQLTDLLHRVGQRIAAGLPRTKGSLPGRVRAASAILNALGGITTVEHRKDGFYIAGKACPVAAAVEADACACGAVTSLVSELVRAQVTEKCNRSPNPACCFAIGAEWDGHTTTESVKS